jgi:hypothetical protein
VQLFPQRTANLRCYKLINWRAVVVELINCEFKKTATQAEAARHHETLPIGTLINDNVTAVEQGAALVFSQGATGAVAVFLYPYKSELSSRQEKLIVWNVFDDPLDITVPVIKRAIADFLCYARVSSVLDSGTPADRRRINTLLKHDHFQSKEKVDAVKQTEEKAREKNETRPSWGVRLSNSTWVVLVTILGTAVTLISGWQPSIDQLRKWVGGTIPSSSQTPDATMPVITGWYTFCPQDNSGASSKMLNLLYDIGQHAGKVAFLDVQIDVECIMGTASNPYAPIGRTVNEHSLTYRFNPVSESGITVDNGRDSVSLSRFLPENGTLVSVLDDGDGRNALTRLGINLEGANDALYGPYLIKARSEDASLSLELSAPTLDTSMQAAASVISEQRRTVHKNDPPPNGLPQPLSLSTEELRQFKELSKPSTEPTDTQPNTAPPLDAKSLNKLPPLPLPISRPTPGTSTQ